MYQSFTVRNFRCFDDLTLDTLQRINLIAGKNNVGKTALLEAIYFHSHAYDPETVISLNTARGIPFAELEQPPGVTLGLFFNLAAKDEAVELEGIDRATGHRVLRFRSVREPDELSQITRRIVPDRPTNGASLAESPLEIFSLEYKQDVSPQQGKVYLSIDARGVGKIDPVPMLRPFPIDFILSYARPSSEENARRYSNLQLAGRQSMLVKALKLLEPNLDRLLVLYPNKLWGELGTKLLPLSLMGDGLNRLANLIMAISENRGGVVLVDEIENGLHYSVLKDVWKVIAKTARELDTQVFATTHSWECIVAAHQAFSEDSVYDFALHRLEQRKDGGIRVVTLDQETLAASIEMGFEVR